MRVARLRRVVHGVRGVVRGVLAAAMAQLRPGRTPRMKQNSPGVLRPGRRSPRTDPTGSFLFVVKTRARAGHPSCLTHALKVTPC